MESNGSLSEKNRPHLTALCEGLIQSASILIEQIKSEWLSLSLLDDLTLLTLGPQLRGGANVKKGIDSINEVFGAILHIVKHSAETSTKSRIQIKNAAGRTVIIQMASDPDIVIFEEMSPGNLRKLIAIEVKGGRDFSNIHNRLGEAEKSHQKAKADGYVECWTVVNVDKTNMALAAKESPTTNQFYLISALAAETGEEYEDFRGRIAGITGIK